MRSVSRAVRLAARSAPDGKGALRRWCGCDVRWCASGAFHGHAQKRWPDHCGQPGRCGRSGARVLGVVGQVVVDDRCARHIVARGDIGGDDDIQ